MPTRRKTNSPRNSRIRGRNEIIMRRGHRINIPSHPTEFDSVPWFKLTVRVNNPTGSLTFGGLYNAFIAQVGNLSFVNAVANVRIMSVRVWGPIPTTNTPLVVQFRDVFDENISITPAGSQNILE